MAYQADYSKGIEPERQANPFQQRMQQGQPGAPPPSAPPAASSNPFYKMGGIGARAMMANRAQSAPAPVQSPAAPPQAPAYGMRPHMQGGMAGIDMPQRGGVSMRVRSPMDYGRGADESFARRRLPPPTGMPGGVMRESGGLDSLRGQVGRTDFNPLRERLMAGGMPPPQQPYGNPFFNQISQGAPQPPIQDERQNFMARLRERANQLPYYGGGPTPWATPEYFRQ